MVSDDLLGTWLDWTGTLQEGEIVFIPAEGVVDPDTGFVPTAIVGDVVVRNMFAIWLDEFLICVGRSTSCPTPDRYAEGLSSNIFPAQPPDLTRSERLIHLLRFDTVEV